MSFLGITGKLQVEDGVVHLVAEELWEPRIALKPASARQPAIFIEEEENEDRNFTTMDTKHAKVRIN